MQDFKYKNPPIKEAVIDIQYETSSMVDVEKMNLLSVIKEDYSTSQKITSFNIKMELHPDGNSDKTEYPHEHTGYKYNSKDEKYVLQCTKNNFTLSRLFPYENWDNFIKEAKRLYNILEKNINDTLSIKRVALRYINSINVPKDCDLEDYFKTIIKVSDELPQRAVAGFLSRILIPQTDIEAQALITQMIEPSQNNEYISVILDVDVFCEDCLQEMKLWEKLEELRDRKNKIFDACITDQTKELFK